MAKLAELRKNDTHTPLMKLAFAAADLHEILRDCEASCGAGEDCAAIHYHCPCGGLVAALRIGCENGDLMQYNCASNSGTRVYYALEMLAQKHELKFVEIED